MIMTVLPYQATWNWQKGWWEGQQWRRITPTAMVASPLLIVTAPEFPSERSTCIHLSLCGHHNQMSQTANQPISLVFHSNIVQHYESYRLSLSPGLFCPETDKCQTITEQDVIKHYISCEGPQLEPYSYCRTHSKRMSVLKIGRVWDHPWLPLPLKRTKQHNTTKHKQIEQNLSWLETWPDLNLCFETNKAVQHVSAVLQYLIIWVVNHRWFPPALERWVRDHGRLPYSTSWSLKACRVRDERSFPFPVHLQKP